MITKKAWAQALKLAEWIKAGSSDRTANAYGWEFTNQAGYRHDRPEVTGVSDALRKEIRACLDVGLSVVKCPSYALTFADGPRDPASGCDCQIYVLRLPSGKCLGVDARLWDLTRGYRLFAQGPESRIYGVDDAGELRIVLMPRKVEAEDCTGEPQKPGKDRALAAIADFARVAVIEFDPQHAEALPDFARRAAALCRRYSADVVKDPSALSTMRDTCETLAPSARYMHGVSVPNPPPRWSEAAWYVTRIRSALDDAQRKVYQAAKRREREAAKRTKVLP